MSNNDSLSIINGLQIKKLDDIKTDDYLAFPTQDLSSFGDQIKEGLFDIGSNIINGYLSGENKEKNIKDVVVDNLSNYAEEKLGISAPVIYNIKEKISVKNIAKVELTASSVIAFAMFVVVMKKLDTIIAYEKAIIDFLETDKLTKLKANLLALNAVVRDYPYNYDNEKFLNNREMQVIDIKREAEHNLIFYKEMLERVIMSEDNTINIDAEKLVESIKKKIEYYRLALYIYSYSCFLDTILLENYNKKYIDSILGDINKYVSEYDNLYESSLKKIKKYTTNSVKSAFLKGVSATSNFIGGLLGKTKAQEKSKQLIDKSKSLDEKREKSIEDVSLKFEDYKKSGIEDIIENFNLFKRLNNEDTEVIISEDMVYIKK